MNRSVRLLTLVLFIAALSACSSGPSDSDAKAAMQDAAKSVAGNVEFLVFEMNSCEKLPDGKTYSCMVKSEIQSPVLGHQSSTGTVKFEKNTDGKWVALLN